MHGCSSLPVDRFLLVEKIFELTVSCNPKIEDYESFFG